MGKDIFGNNTADFGKRILGFTGIAVGLAAISRVGEFIRR